MTIKFWGNFRRLIHNKFHVLPGSTNIQTTPSTHRSTWCRCPGKVQYPVCSGTLTSPRTVWFASCSTLNNINKHQLICPLIDYDVLKHEFSTIFVFWVETFECDEWLSGTTEVSCFNTCATVISDKMSIMSIKKKKRIFARPPLAFCHLNWNWQKTITFIDCIFENSSEISVAQY